MGVVTYNGQGYSNPTTSQAPDRTFAESQDKLVFSLVNVANGDSATSVAYIGRVPSDARFVFGENNVILPAIAGLTSLSVGLAKPAQDVNNPPVSASAAQIANILSATCLLNAVNVAAGGTFALGPTTGNWKKRAWELAGLAADPGGYLDVIATIGNAAGAAGTLEFFLGFARGGP